MADQTIQPPKESFHLSMLLYDQRYRSMTIQVIVLIAFLSGFFWLAEQRHHEPCRFGQADPV